MRVKVAQRYAASSDGFKFGPWEEGDEVDLTDVQIAWVNRDAEGTLTPIKEKEKASVNTEDEFEPKPKSRSGVRQNRGMNRMHTDGPDRDDE